MTTLLNNQPGPPRMDSSIQALDKVTHVMASGPAAALTVPGGFVASSYMDIVTQDNLIFAATFTVLLCQLFAYAYKFTKWVRRKFLTEELTTDE